MDQVFGRRIQARQVMEDFDAVHTQLDHSLNLMDQTYRQFHSSQPGPRVYAGGHFDLHSLDPMMGCARSNLERSYLDLLGTRFGLTVGGDVPRWGVSLRYVYSSYHLSLNETGTSSQVSPDRGYTYDEESGNYSKELASLGQATHAVRLQLTQWAALTVGGITGSQGQGPQQFFRLEVPKVRALLELIPGKRGVLQSADTFHAGIQDVGAGPLRLGLRASYLADEGRPFLAARLDWVGQIPGSGREEHEEEMSTSSSFLVKYLDLSELRLGLELAPEVSESVLRYAKATALATFFGATSSVETLSEGEGSPDVWSFRVRLGIFASVFDGQWLRQSQGENQVPGAGLSVEGGLVTIAGSAISLDMTIPAINDPELLSIMPWAAGALDFRAVLTLRLGFGGMN